MKPDVIRVPENSLGSLSACLVDGDPAQHRLASKIRRRAILLSVILQTITVAVLIVFPLLGKGERLPAWIVVPPPPYRLGSNHPNPASKPHGDRHDRGRFNFSNYSDAPIRPNSHTGNEPNPGPQDPPGVPEGPIGVRNGILDGFDPPHNTPAPPAEDRHVTEQHHRVTITHIDPSRITFRTEPIYPSLGRQLHRETRVELRAIISTDGSIQSLQVVSGDPLFYQSALDAVRQWRYTPTLLNDRPVEVDTHITVIYSLIR
jgi:TonB family protein